MFENVNLQQAIDDRIKNCSRTGNDSSTQLKVDGGYKGSIVCNSAGRDLVLIVTADVGCKAHSHIMVSKLTKNLPDR